MVDLLVLHSTQNCKNSQNMDKDILFLLILL